MVETGDRTPVVISEVQRKLQEIGQGVAQAKRTPYQVVNFEEMSARHVLVTAGAAITSKLLPSRDAVASVQRHFSDKPTFFSKSLKRGSARSGSISGSIGRKVMSVERSSYAFSRFAMA